MKKRITYLIVASMLISNISISFGYTYYKDILNHWAEDYIDWASNDVMLFKGYEDATFKPENNITRGEFIAIVNRLLEMQNTSYLNAPATFTLGYTDIDRSFWGFQDIRNLAYYLKKDIGKDISEIFPGNSLNPNLTINRYEASTIINLVTGYSAISSNRTYTDLYSELKFYDEIIELSNKGIVQGYEDGSFRPWNKITRAEASKIISKSHDELEYLKDNMMELKSIDDFDLLRKNPLFKYDGTSNQSTLDRKFSDAVTTLEYISFVGYIPYNERHLYDADPINTLWSLKNEDYNTIKVNYYLLKYDKSLVNERKKELILEASLEYKNEQNKEDIIGMANFVELSKEIINSDQMITFLEDIFISTDDNNEKIVVGTLLVEEYAKTSRYKEAIDIYNIILKISKDVRLNTRLTLNNGYLIYKSTNKTEAISYISKEWNRIKGENEYKMYSSEVDFMFNSMIKQLMAEQI